MTLHRAFNLIATLNVISSILAVIFYLMADISSNEFKPKTALTIVDCTLMVVQGTVAATSFKKCFILRDFAFARHYRNIKFVYCGVLLTTAVTKRIIKCYNSKSLECKFWN